MPRRPKRPVPPELIADILALEKRVENLLATAKEALGILEAFTPHYPSAVEAMTTLRNAIEDVEALP